MTTRKLLKLTPKQLECVISVVELTLDATSASFADWCDANPDSVSALRGAERELRAAERRPGS